MQINEIIEKLKRDCGLVVERAEIPGDTRSVVEDEASGKTVFSVAAGGRTYAFSVSGTGEERRVTASLARELVMRYLAAGADDPVRDFLNGMTAVPPLHVGKADYYVFALYCGEKHARVRDYVATMAGCDDIVADMAEDVTAFCKKSDKNDDYRSAGEFAVVLRENLAEEIKSNVKIGVGGVAHGASELPEYYSYARAALVSGAELDPGSDIYSYKEYALIKILSELPAGEKDAFIRTALGQHKEVLADVELMTAADAFIKHSLNISEASRNMYVHRNTLIYRLDKIEKMTGLNIRSFNDAMTFRVAYLLATRLDKTVR